MSQANIDLTKRWFEEVWNQGREEAIDRLYASDAVAYGLDGGDGVRGPEGFKPFHRQLCGAFARRRFTVADAMASGDMVALRWTAEMDHTGDHLGKPATGKTVHLTGMVFCRIRDGQIHDSWNNWDMLGFLSAIGVIDLSTVIER